VIGDHTAKKISIYTFVLCGGEEDGQYVMYTSTNYWREEEGGGGDRRRRL
jgi:hypothetical protein